MGGLCGATRWPSSVTSAVVSMAVDSQACHWVAWLFICRPVAGGYTGQFSTGLWQAIFYAPLGGEVARYSARGALGCEAVWHLCVRWLVERSRFPACHWVACHFRLAGLWQAMCWLVATGLWLFARCHLVALMPFDSVDAVTVVAIGATWWCRRRHRHSSLPGGVDVVAEVRCATR